MPENGNGGLRSQLDAEVLDALKDIAVIKASQEREETQLNAMNKKMDAFCEGNEKRFTVVEGKVDKIYWFAGGASFAFSGIFILVSWLWDKVFGNKG